MPDADLDRVAAAVTSTGYANAGQVCISTQRVLAAGKVYGDFLDALKPKVAALTLGDQLDEKTKVGPMVREKEAVRVAEWVKEAVAQGARVVVGGERRGALYPPTIVADVKPEMRISCDELFGPAVAWPRSTTSTRRSRSPMTASTASRRDLHREPGVGVEVRARGPVGQPPHQLGAAVARGPHALWRPQGLGLRQGGAVLRRAGDDGTQDGGVPPVDLGCIIRNRRPPSPRPSPSPRERGVISKTLAPEGEREG